MMGFSVPDGTEDPEAFANDLSRALRGIGAALNPSDRSKVQVYGNNLDTRPDLPTRRTVRDVLLAHGILIPVEETGKKP